LQAFQHQRGLNDDVNTTVTHFMETYEFEHVPVKDVVVGEALAVEQIPEELS